MVFAIQFVVIWYGSLKKRIQHLILIIWGFIHVSSFFLSNGNHFDTLIYIYIYTDKQISKQTNKYIYFLVSSSLIMDMSEVTTHQFHWARSPAHHPEFFSQRPENFWWAFALLYSTEHYSFSISTLTPLCCLFLLLFLLLLSSFYCCHSVALRLKSSHP